MPEKRATIERIAPNAEPPDGRLKTLTCRSTKAVRALIDAAIRQVLALFHSDKDARLQRQRKSGLGTPLPGCTTRGLCAGRRTSSWRSWSTTVDRGNRTTRRSAKPASADRQAKPKARLARPVLDSMEAA